MTNKSIRYRIMFGQVSRFFAENATLTLSARSTAQVALVNTTITEVDSLGIDQIAGFGESAGGTTSRRTLAATLRGKLVDMQFTAETFDPVVFPGAADTFQLPASRTYAALLAT